VVLARHQLSLLTDLLIAGSSRCRSTLIMGYTGMVSFGHAAYFGLAPTRAPSPLHFAQPVPVGLSRRELAGRAWRCGRWFSTRATIISDCWTLAFAQFLYTVATSGVT